MLLQITSLLSIFPEISCKTGWDDSFWCSRLIFDHVFHFYRSLLTWLMSVYSKLRITELITGSYSLFFAKISATLFWRPTFKSTSHRSHQWLKTKPKNTHKKITAVAGSYSSIHTDKFCWSMQPSPTSIKPTFLLTLTLGSKGSKEVFLQTGIIKDL